MTKKLNPASSYNSVWRAHHVLTPHVSVEQVSFWAAAEMARRRATEDLSTTLKRPMIEMPWVK